MDLTTQRFGKLIVSRDSGTRKRGQIVWECTCDCGGTTLVAAYALTSGNTKSCGCYRVERGREHGATINLRHGEGSNGKETVEYRTWSNMLSRCENANHAAYPHYGGRGIAVCERWHSYENFLADMGRRPSPEHSIDRFPNKDGNYEQDNCRWATSVEQNNNARFNHLLTFPGGTKTIAEWCELTGIPRSVVGKRLARGMDPFDALTTPVGPYVRKL